MIFLKKKQMQNFEFTLMAKVNAVITTELQPHVSQVPPVGYNNPSF